MQIRTRIRRIAIDNTLVIFADHARTQMRMRHIPADVVLEVLRKGRIRRTPEPNLSTGSIECRMERFVAGAQTGVIAAISNDRPNVIVVTAMLIGTSS